MNCRILPYIARYQTDLEQVLSCSKELTLKRMYRIRCKNVTYYKDGTIYSKIVKNVRDKITDRKIKDIFKIKETWRKEKFLHRSEIDPKTGRTLPAMIISIHKRNIPGAVPVAIEKSWYYEGVPHRVEKDPETGVTLPAYIGEDGIQTWYKDGVAHRVEKDSETGLTLPAHIGKCGRKEWWKEGKLHRDEVDRKTGLPLPAYHDPIHDDVYRETGSLLLTYDHPIYDEVYPDSGRQIYDIRSGKRWFINGIEKRFSLRTNKLAPKREKPYW